MGGKANTAKSKLMEKKQREREREREKNKIGKHKFTGRAHGNPGDYAEELGPLPLLGRRSETGAGWLSDAGVT